MNRRLVAFLAPIICLALPQIAAGQNDGYLNNSNTRGLQPANSFQTAEIDEINFANGAVNLRIPILDRKGRSINKKYYFTYSSKIWSLFPTWDYLNPSSLDSLSWGISDSPTIQGGYNNFNFAGLNPAYITGNETAYDCFDKTLQENVEETVDADFSYISEDGSTSRLPNLHRDASPSVGFWCTGVTVQSTGYSENGTIWLDTTNHPYIAHLKDGTQNTYNWFGDPQQLTDTNGNFINANGDTLLRLVSATDNYPTLSWTYTFKDSNNATQTVTVLYSPGSSATTAFPSTSCGVVPISQYTGQLGGTATITLPDGRTYGITFDPTFGEVTKVTLPTGGYIRYVYTTLAVFDQAPGWGQCASYGGIDSRRLEQRFVSYDGNSGHEVEWQYSYSTGTNSYTTTVTDPLGNVTVHTFGTMGIDQRTHETQVQYYDNASHLLKTVANTWAYDSGPVASNIKAGRSSVTSVLQTDYKNWRITNTTTTLNDTGQVNQTAKTYDSFSYMMAGSLHNYTESYNNVLTQSDYDWGNGSPGALLRFTVNTYLYSNNSNYLNAHMLDRLASATIYDSSGNTCLGQSRACSQTTYGYDTTTIQSRSGAVQHDYTDYPASMTTRGNQTTISEWNNVANSWLTTTKYYDELGNLVEITDPNSNSTYFGYTDSWSNSGCAPSGGSAFAFVTSVTNAKSQVTTATYNSCSSIIASTTDPNSQTISAAYDGLDRVTQYNFPDSGQTSFCYSDTAGSACNSTSNQVVATQLNSSGNVLTTATWDGLGRLAQTQLTSDPAGADATVTTYDALNRVSQKYNPTRCSTPTTNCGEYTWGYTTDAYDALGRTTAVTEQDGSVASTTYSGNCATLTDEAGKQRKTCSDAVGRLTQVFEDPNNSNLETDYTYDALGNMLSVTQKGGTTNSAQWRVRSFIYDSLSRLTSATNPESGTTAYTYDSVGNILTRTDARGAITTYCYDQLNRVTGKRYAVATCPLSLPDVSYTYDLTQTPWGEATPNSIGRLSWAVANNSAGCAGVVMGYDPMGRMTHRSSSSPTTCGVVAYVTTLSYDLIGDLTQYTNPEGNTLTEHYDASGRPVSLTASWSDSQHPGTMATVNSYYPTSQVRQMTYGNSLVQSNAIEPRLQICQISLGTGAPSAIECGGPTPPGNLQTFWYVFGSWGSTDSGNVTAWGASGQQNFNRSYTYDAVNRLSTMGSSGDYTGCTGLSWSYDAWGNRTAQAVTAGSCPNAFTASFSQNTNRMDNYSYDAAGNLLNDGIHSYAYDNESRIISVDGGATATYSYDPMGQRVETNANGTKTDFVYLPDGRVVDEYQYSSGYNGGIMSFAYLGDRTIAEYRNATTYFMHPDHLGSTRVMTDVNGQVDPNGVFDYMPFGESLVASTLTTHKFTGKERDAESGLDYFGARHYTSMMGRFMSADWSAIPEPVPYAKFNEPQTLNLYTYTGNNPVSLTDPDGHCADGLDCNEDGGGGDINESPGELEDPDPGQNTSNPASTPQGQGTNSQAPSSNTQAPTPNANSDVASIYRFSRWLAGMGAIGNAEQSVASNTTAEVGYSGTLGNLTVDNKGNKTVNADLPSAGVSVDLTVGTKKDGAPAGSLGGGLTKHTSMDVNLNKGPDGKITVSGYTLHLGVSTPTSPVHASGPVRPDFKWYVLSNPRMRPILQ